MPLIEIRDIEAIEEIDNLYTGCAVGKDESVNEKLIKLHAKGYDINVFTYDELNNGRPTTPLLCAILHRNTAAVRILCDQIKSNISKYGDLLTYCSYNELPLTTAIRVGEKESITHILNAGGRVLATTNDRLGPPVSVAFSSIPMHALVHYGRWESSSVDIQPIMEKFYKIKHDVDAKLRAVTIPAGEYTVHWSSIDLLKQLFKKKADANIAPTGKLSVTELLEDIVNHASNEKLAFQSDYPEAQLKFHKDQSDKDTLVFTQFLVNPFKQQSPSTIKVIIDLKPIRKLVLERNQEIEREEKEQFEKQQGTMDLKQLKEELHDSHVKLMEAQQEKLKSHIDNVAQEALQTQHEVKKTKEQVEAQQKLLNTKLGAKAEVQIEKLIANKSVERCFDRLSRNLNSLLESWVVLSGGKILRVQDTGTDTLASIVGIGSNLPSPFCSIFKGLSKIIGRKADKDELQRFKSIQNLMPSDKSIQVYSRELSAGATQLVVDHLNMLREHGVNRLTLEDAEKISTLLLGIIAYSIYNVNDLQIDPTHTAAVRNHQLTQKLFVKVSSEPLLVQMLEQILKNSISPPQTPEAPAKKAPAVPEKPPVVLFSLMNLSAAQAKAATSAENKKTALGAVKETVKETLKSRALYSHT